ncbi:MAG: M15 family metallopeptidase [Limnospira sp.]
MLPKIGLLIGSVFLAFFSSTFLSNSATEIDVIPQSITAEEAQKPPGLVQNYNPVSNSDRLVDIESVNPNIRLDIRYATSNNFLGRSLYSVPRCLLRADVADRLSRVQDDLENMGLGLMVYDCYRPWSVTRQMWEILPDSRYVANPSRGSRHNRGAAVDLTLVDLKTGEPLEMPTDFDDFTETAARDYWGNPPQVRRNSDLLEYKMKKQGFVSLITEWWHFDAEDWQRYDLLDIGLDEIP